jgi:hypothetical protein
LCGLKGNLKGYDFVGFCGGMIGKKYKLGGIFE